MTSPTQFYDEMPVGVCIVKRDRKDMRVLYANSELTKLMSPRKSEVSRRNMIYPEDVTGKLLAEIWPHEDIIKLVKSLGSPAPPNEYTLPVVGTVAQNNQRWAMLSITTGTHDDTPCFILWATDISFHKEVEMELQEAFQEADAAAQMKSNFLATMSHEIRTPMQSVYGLLELVGEEKPDVHIMSMVNTAKTSASGLLEILDDILDFAKMDADKMELDTFEVPVRTLVYGICEAMAVKIHGHEVILDSHIEKDVPFVVVGDPKRLRQILMNLTGNALKFTAQGRVSIRVSHDLQHIEKPEHGTALRFEIIDSGIGMDKDAQERLFKPFNQADSSTSRKFGGTGLGLSICKKLVEKMGGKIGADSVEGQGSTFWFEIPTEEVSTDDNTMANMPVLDGISVLSVEDHPQGAKEIVRSLESMGATVESCPTYQEGLELAKRRPFDVGIIDQGLPDGLGVDLIREILTIRPFMGLMMYTVRDDLGLQHTLNTLGVKYLTKPASRIGLGEAVKDAASRAATYTLSGPQKLLIAEDTQSVRDILQRQLTKLGVEADFVENGKQAMDALKSGEYGLLITDLHMPGMDGYAVVEAIRDKESDEASAARFPVIVLTADVQMAQRQVYLDHGFDECILKPVSLGQFQRLLIRWGLLDKDNHNHTETGHSDPAQVEEASAASIDTPPTIDLAAMKAQMGAVDQGAIDMMHMFVDMTAPLITRLSTAFENKDYHDLKEAAHSLKGAARSACCIKLGDIADTLQTDAGVHADTCADLIEDATQEFANVKSAVKSLVPQD